ncbi:MAG: hypothetical protein H0W72_01135 [Planctomycetes bacterium]|nr:hypothetical protein [Planctomycetota bacterium]
MDHADQPSDASLNDVALVDRTFIRPLTGRIARLRVYRRLRHQPAEACESTPLAVFIAN